MLKLNLSQRVFVPMSQIQLLMKEHLTLSIEFIPSSTHIFTLHPKFIHVPQDAHEAPYQKFS